MGMAKNAGDPDLPLIRAVPGLSRRRLALATLPTPVGRLSRLGPALGVPDLWIKHDDLAGDPYGGNKVRKLEFLLADAESKGARTLLAIGAAGSNFVAAAACYARQRGLETVALLADQPNAAYVRRNLLLGAHWGARQLRCRTKAELIARRAWLRMAIPRCYPLALGGSSAIGTLGYVNAGLELAEQIAAGLLPGPAAVFVPTGSMGTQAGLMLGMALAGLDVPVFGIPVMTRFIPWRWAIGRLYRQTLDLLMRECAGAGGAGEWKEPGKPGEPGPPAESGMAERLAVARSPGARQVWMVHGHAGHGYAHFSQRGLELARMAADLEGLTMDGTYTAKALSGAVAAAQALGLAGGPVLFWQTLNGRDLGPVLDSCAASDVPAEFAHYFARPPQAFDPG